MSAKTATPSPARASAVPRAVPMVKGSHEPSSDLPTSFKTVPRGAGLAMENAENAKREAEREVLTQSLEQHGQEMWTPPYDKRVEIEALTR